MNVAQEQLRLALGPFTNRRLFSEHFLEERLPEWSEFQAVEPSPLREALRRLWAQERAGLLAGANEAQTEERFIQPVLRALGFTYTVQAGLQAAPGLRRQPDYALFLEDSDRAHADLTHGVARYASAVAVADAKRFDRPLDVRRPSAAESEDPVAQIVSYVRATQRPWGILTNGRIWRLYSLRGDLVEGACLELDLVALLEADDAEPFRYFAAFLSAGAFAAGPDGRSFLDRALVESEAHAIAVGDGLQRQVFLALPGIARGLLDDDEPTDENLRLAFEHALVVLYRILFCLHAEARGLLPVESSHYNRYSLRRLGSEVAEERDRGQLFSTQSDDLYNDLRALFRMVDKGDPALGVNEYDGGLFSAARHPYFSGRSVPDDLMAPALDALFRVGGLHVDYKDLSIRHLGSIYERLLEFRLQAAGDGLALVPSAGRHQTGSYFTPEHVVDRIVELTLDPVLVRYSEAAAETGLSGDAALEHFLGVRVLDPAMGSGHFLVSAAAYVARFIATDPSYDGDLGVLDVQRLVAERCIYGVDLNPMAVELAQLSLWLATVRDDEPLTFLSNLRVGNALVGADVGSLTRGQAGDLFADRLRDAVPGLLDASFEIARRESHDGRIVRDKERLAAAARELRAPLERYADDALAPAFSNGVRPFFHWELEFPEVFLTPDGHPRDDGGFDAVIGNPPYVRIQELGRDLAEYCRRHYDTASGSFDVYIPFLERGLQLLTRGGRLGFILPNKLFKNEYGERMRDRFADRGLVDEIVDFGDAQLFPGVTNYTCILVLDRQGTDELRYRRVRGSAADVRDQLDHLASTPVATFRAGDLGSDPWVLATGEEAALLRTARAGSERLDEITQQIFQGLITSADRIYILEDRGARGGRRVVYSRASGRELELEPDLLHPLASGADVARYAFPPLRALLLFPYVRVEGEMRLLDEERLAALPLTAGYLREHEQTLRARERGKMDHAGWYGYVYPKSLGAHDLPKLGVPRMCARLRASADPDGGVYLDNVDVNGILVHSDGASVWLLDVLLNSRLLDWMFRRGSVPFRGDFLSANKQFIAPLPIQLPDDPRELEALGRRLHDAAAAIHRERAGFLDWLGATIGHPARSLPGGTTLAGYAERTPDELIDVLSRSSTRLSVDPQTRAFRERLTQEHATSVARLAEHASRLTFDERSADTAVYDLYRLTAAQRRLVDAEYV